MRHTLAIALMLLLVLSSCNIKTINVDHTIKEHTLYDEVKPEQSTTTEIESYVQGLVNNKIVDLGLENRTEEDAIKTTYEYVVTNYYFSDPVGLDCWRYLSDEIEPIPYLENRSLSPLLFNIASCEDFASVLTMMLNSLDIEAKYVAGYTLSIDQVFIDHAWVMVKYDNDWYHLDPQLEQNIVRNNRLTYRYFMKTDADMEFDHKWGENLVEYWINMPEAEKDNILTNYNYPNCNTIYPAIAPKNILLPKKPDMLAIELELNALKANPLPPISLNIEPPILVAQYHITPSLMPEYQISNPTNQRYGRQFLNPNQQQLYEDFANILEHPNEKSLIKPSPNLEQEEINQALSVFYDDYPEYYWAEIIPCSENDSFLQLNNKNGLSTNEINQKTKRLEAKSSEILQNLVGKSQFDKAVAIHDYLGSAMYDSGFKVNDSDNAYGAIVDNVAYCNGYARGFQFLANKTGLNSIYIRGRDVKGTTHAWNAVELEGNWYYIDVTWDRESNSYGGSYHDFFGMSLDESLRERVWDDSQYPSLPESNSTDCNFYVKNNYTIEINANSIAYDSLDEIAEICNRQLSTKDNLTNEYKYSFVEFKIVGNNNDYLKWKNSLTKELFNILKKMDADAKAEGLNFSVSYDTEVACYYNDSMQIVAFYPKVKNNCNGK